MDTSVYCSANVGEGLAPPGDAKHRNDPWGVILPSGGKSHPYRIYRKYTTDGKKVKFLMVALATLAVLCIIKERMEAFQ
jgi:hypothetical protein